MQPRVMTDRERRGKLHRRRRQLRDVREQARLCEAPPETAAPVSDRLQKKERAYQAALRERASERRLDVLARCPRTAVRGGRVDRNSGFFAAIRGALDMRAAPRSSERMIASRRIRGTGLALRIETADK
jgi:hypothetical protein